MKTNSCYPVTTILLLIISGIAVGSLVSFLYAIGVITNLAAVNPMIAVLGLIFAIIIWTTVHRIIIYKTNHRGVRPVLATYGLINLFSSLGLMTTALLNIVILGPFTIFTVGIASAFFWIAVWSYALFVRGLTVIID